MFIIGSSSLFVMGIQAKQDTWLAILLAIAVGLLIAAIYARLISILPGKDFYETLECFFGKVSSEIILIILTWFAIDLCNIVLQNFGHFIVTVGLPETPIKVVFFAMLLVTALATRYGIEVIGRYNRLFLIVVGAFIVISLYLALQKIEPTHLRPMLYGGLSPILQGAFSVFSFPIAEIVVFLLVLPALKPEESAYKMYLGGLLIGGLVILLTSTMDLLVIGTMNAEKSIFPTYEALSVLKAGKIERFEIIAATIFMLTIFIKITVLLVASCKGISKIFGLPDYRSVALPVTLLVGVLACISFHNIPAFRIWGQKVYPYYAALFQWILPLFIFVFIEIKYRILKRAGRLPI